MDPDPSGGCVGELRGEPRVERRPRRAAPGAPADDAGGEHPVHNSATIAAAGPSGLKSTASGGVVVAPPKVVCAARQRSSPDTACRAVTKARSADRTTFEARRGRRTPSCDLLRSAAICKSKAAGQSSRPVMSSFRGVMTRRTPSAVIAIRPPDQRAEPARRRRDVTMCRSTAREAAHRDISVREVGGYGCGCQVGGAGAATDAGRRRAIARARRPRGDPRGGRERSRPAQAPRHGSWRGSRPRRS